MALALHGGMGTAERRTRTRSTPGLPILGGLHLPSVASVKDGAVAVARTAWTAGHIFIDDQGLSWAGAIGLFLFLSVPPFMVATVYIGSSLWPPAAVEGFVLEQVAKYLPAEQGLVNGIVASQPEHAGAAALSLGLLLFSGSRAFAALTSAINVMWRRVDRLTFVWRQVLRLGMLVVALLLMGVAALGEGLVGAVSANGADGGQLWLLDWQVIPTALLAAFLLVAYRFLPREPVSWTHAAIGSATATAGVRLAQAAIGLVGEAGTLRTPYGDLADVALLATWALVVGIVVLYGAALVAVLEGKRPIDHEADERFSRGG
ncbi:MAG TPA: YihY/virulence factor BrkB family protein [Candidatus Limnocylindria bacterium]|nr:YihY/virulence factor BrkB family protein [Candidatus Limnocylindria bacterium]